MLSRYTLAIPSGSRVWDLCTENVPKGLFLLIPRNHLLDWTTELGKCLNLRYFTLLLTKNVSF